MVVRRRHGAYPAVVAKLQMTTNLVACQADYVELILVAIEVEHIAHIYGTAWDDSVVGQRCIERDVSMCDVKLQLVYEVAESTVAKIAVAGVHRSVGLSEWTVYITIYLVNVFLEIFHKFKTLGEVSNVHYVARYVFVDNFSVLDVNRYACVADGKSIA